MATAYPLDDQYAAAASYPDDAPAAPVEPDYTELLSWLQSEAENAKDTTLDEQRAIALSFYNGELFGDEEAGRSQIVTRDVAEVIDYMVPSVLRTMASGDRVVEFEALDAGFKDILEDANEAVSQQFMQEQKGWRILHDSLKAGLLEKTGAIKSYVDEKKTRREMEVTASQLAMMSSQGITPTEAEPIGQFAQMDEAMQAHIMQGDPAQLDQLGPIMKVAWIETAPVFVDEPVPNEELQIAKDARSIEESFYHAHVPPKTLSELAEMGFDTKDIETGESGQTSSLARRRDGDAQDTSTIYRDGAGRKVDYREEYCRYDMNGDGIAELLLVQRVGNKILRHKDGSYAVKEVDYGSIEEWCPFPMPHRRVGQSLADKVMDIQRTRSVLMRQAFDNLYQSNMPRILLHEDSIGESTIDDFLTVRPNAFARWKGTNKPEPWAVPFVAGHAFEAMEILTGERESRTGITRLNQGLDADALNKTATGTALMQAQGQQIEEYIARNFAEFIGRVFAKKYRLMRDYGKPFSIIMDGQPKQVDPGAWPEEMRVNVRVGLGSGRKEQRIQYRMTVLNLQSEARAAGDPNVGPQQIFNSVKGLVADLGLGQATDFYADPATMQQGQGEDKPDPAMVKAQADVERGKAELQMKQFDMQQRHSQAQGTLQLKLMEIQGKLSIASQDAQARMQLEQQRDYVEMQLAQQAQQYEASMDALKLHMQAQSDAREHDRRDREADTRMKTLRKGGALNK